MAELEDAGVEKSEKDLFLDFLQKCGEQLKITVLRDRRFWPNPVTKEPAFRRARTWQEAATIAKESCVVDETSWALTDNGFQSTTVAAEPPRPKAEARGGTRTRRTTRPTLLTVSLQSLQIARAADDLAKPLSSAQKKAQRDETRSKP